MGRIFDPQATVASWLVAGWAFLAGWFWGARGRKLGPFSLLGCTVRKKKSKEKRKNAAVSRARTEAETSSTAKLAGARPRGGHLAGGWRALGGTSNVWWRQPARSGCSAWGYTTWTAELVLGTSCKTGNGGRQSDDHGERRMVAGDDLMLLLQASEQDKRDEGRAEQKKGEICAQRRPSPRETAAPRWIPLRGNGHRCPAATK
jgi:hypothetical protein